MTEGFSKDRRIRIEEWEVMKKREMGWLLKKGNIGQKRRRKESRKKNNIRNEWNRKGIEKELKKKKEKAKYLK